MEQTSKPSQKIDKPIPRIAGYRTFLLALSPFLLAFTALIILALVRPELIDISTILQIITLGTSGPVAGMAARTVDKRTARG